MDQRTRIALVVLAAAGFGYLFFKNRKDKADEEAALQDQGPADVAQNYYTSPPLFAASAGTNGNLYVNQQQAMPLPYNT